MYLLILFIYLYLCIYICVYVFVFMQNAAHIKVFSKGKNVQIVRLTAGENVLGKEQVLSAGNVLHTFNLQLKLNTFQC